MNRSIASSVAVLTGAVLCALLPAHAQNFPPVVTQKIQAAQKQVKTIGMEEYRKLVESPGDALLVDVREPGEFAAGHVPGAPNQISPATATKKGANLVWKYHNWRYLPLHRRKLPISY